MQGDICAICCGTGREQTIHCPLDCEYLQEARKHEIPPIASDSEFPNADIRITEQFLRENEALLLWISVRIMRAALTAGNIVDDDIKEALAALVQTYRTLQSGLVYESKPANPLAAGICLQIQDAVAEYRKEMQQQAGIPPLRDAAILGVLAFLQRMEIQHNNGRRLGRAFVDFLRFHFPQATEHRAPTSLVI